MRALCQLTAVVLVALFAYACRDDAPAAPLRPPPSAAAALSQPHAVPAPSRAPAAANDGGAPPFPDQLTRLSLPFTGTWAVGQGYNGSESHFGRAAYALDLVKLDEHGNAYARNGKQTRDWYVFGAEALATADGVVVRAIDRYPDNRVLGGSLRTNTVIIQHNATELSEYVHLKRGSVRVHVGDHVVRDQVLALCGNSGAQTPHLHWALLSSLEPIQTRPARFTDYEVWSERGAWRSASGTPKSGDVLRARQDARGL